MAAARQSESWEVGEFSRLIDHITVATTFGEEARLLDELKAASFPTVVSFINAHTMNIAREDRVLFEDLLDSSMLLRDGIGMSILLRLVGKSPGLNSNGTDLIPKIASGFKGRPVALLGTEDAYALGAADYARRAGCEVVLVENGFQQPEVYVEEVQETRPELVVLGMGTPKQERVAQIIARNVDYPVVIVNGGAILDRWAGRFRRAPVLIRRLGAEWLYRLALEPRRLWRRYLIGNWRFLSWSMGLVLAGERAAAAPALAHRWPPPDMAVARAVESRGAIAPGWRESGNAPAPRRTASVLSVGDIGGADG